MTDLDRSWLVQRLRKPPKREHPIFGKDNPFSFGGGLQNGGLSGEAMDLLREVWSFDYMGAAEFEWGAVPEALSRLAKAKQLNGSEFDIKLSEVAANWRRRDEKPPEEFSSMESFFHVFAEIAKYVPGLIEEGDDGQ